MKIRARDPGAVSGEHPFLGNVFSKQEVIGRWWCQGEEGYERLPPEARESGRRVIRVKVGTIKGGKGGGGRGANR